MTLKLIPAALIAAMLATPSTACTDWQAIAAFDAATAAVDQAMIAAMCVSQTSELCNATVKGLANHHNEIEQDRAAALADKCQEDGQ